MRFIHSYQRSEGFPPTVRQVGAHLGCSSPSTAHNYIVRLERAGVIERVSRRNSILRVTLLGKSVLNGPRVAA